MYQIRPRSKAGAGRPAAANKSKGENLIMFNFGGCGCNDGCGGSELWSCLLNLIILFIVLEFLCNIITGAGGLNCGLSGGYGNACCSNNCC